MDALTEHNNLKALLFVIFSYIYYTLIFSVSKVLSIHEMFALSAFKWKLKSCITRYMTTDKINLFCFLYQNISRHETIKWHRVPADKYMPLKKTKQNNQKVNPKVRVVCITDLTFILITTIFKVFDKR